MNTIPGYSLSDPSVLPFVIIPVTLTFNEKGVAMSEAAQFTFVLKKEASGWLIQAWTWTGPRAHKTAAPVKK